MHARMHGAKASGLITAVSSLGLIRRSTRLQAKRVEEGVVDHNPLPDGFVHVRGEGRLCGDFCALSALLPPAAGRWLGRFLSGCDVSGCDVTWTDIVIQAGGSKLQGLFPYAYESIIAR